MSPIAAEVGLAYVRIIPSMRGFSAAVSKEMSSGLDSAVKKSAAKSGSNLKDSFSKSAKVAGVAAGAALGVGLAGAVSADTAMSKFRAQAGDAKWADAAGKAAGDLYKDAYGDSMGQAADAVRSVMTAGLLGGNATAAQIEAITGKAISLAQAFDQEVGPLAAAAGQMIKTGMARNSAEAFDIITRGFQLGVDKSGDFLDTLNEYGTQFRKLGIDGATATGLLSQGLKAGARDADVVADAFKEFSIRSTDGAKTSREAYKALGLDAKTFEAEISKGGDSASKATQKVLVALNKMAPGVKKNTALFGLFGTQSEDLGAALGSLNLNKAAGELGTLGGAADKLDQTLNDNASVTVTAFKRQMEAGLIETMAGAITAIKPVTDELVKYKGVVVPLVGSLAGFAAAVWTVNAATKAWTASTKALTAAKKVLTPALTGAAKAGRAFTTAAAAAGRMAATVVAAAGRAAAAAVRWAASMAASAAKATASMVAAAARQVAAWTLIAARAMANAARIAAAWLISMGPIGIIIAAVAGLTVVIVKNWDKIKSVITGATTAVINFVKAKWPLLLAILTGPFGLAVLAIAKNWDKIVSTAKAVPGKIKSAFSGMGTLLVNTGKDLIQGFINGIKNKAGDILNAIKDSVTDKIPGWIKKPLGIGSPSKLTAQYGKWLAEGMANGIKAGAKDVAAAQQSLTDQLKAKIEDARSLAKEIQGAFTLDLSATQVGEDGTAGDSLLKRMDAQAAQAEQFATTIKRLRKAGLRDDLIKALTAQGPSALAAAQEMAANVGLVNKMASRVAKAGKALSLSEVLAREGVNLKGGKVAGGGLFTDSQIGAMGSGGGSGSAPFNLIIQPVSDSKKFMEWLRYEIRAQTGGNVQKALGQRG